VCPLSDREIVAAYPLESYPLPQVLKSDQKLTELREDLAATKVSEDKAVNGVIEAAVFNRRRRFVRDVGRAGAAAAGER
jgi:hypothetical protein